MHTAETTRTLTLCILFFTRTDENENLIVRYRQILADVDVETLPEAKRAEHKSERGGVFAKMLSAANLKTCKTDYDCNPGGRNWPLRCVDVFVSKICMGSDDGGGGGGGGGGSIASLSMLPIPVLAEDGYFDDDGASSTGGDQASSVSMCTCMCMGVGFSQSLCMCACFRRACPAG